MVPHLEYSFAALNILSQWSGFVNVEGDGVDKGRDSNGRKNVLLACASAFRLGKCESEGS